MASSRGGDVNLNLSGDFAARALKRHGDPAERIRDILLTFHLGLFRKKDFVCSALLRSQSQHIPGSQRIDRSLHDSGARGALADLSGYGGSDGSIRGFTHEGQSPPDDAIRNRFERLLLQLHHTL